MNRMEHKSKWIECQASILVPFFQQQNEASLKPYHFTRQLRNIAAIVAIISILGGCASDPASNVISSSPHRNIKRAIDNMLAREVLPYSIAAIKVISLRDKRVIYETNADLLVTPASVQKLFTAAAALDFLGSQHSLETSLFVNSEQKVLYLSGCGDPLLSSDDINKLADNLPPTLARDQRYKLVGDSSCFDDAYWGSGWMWDDEPNTDAMYLSALSVNGNAVTVTVLPSDEVGLPVKVASEPQTQYVRFENTAVTNAPSSGCAAQVTRDPGDRANVIRVTGKLSVGCPPIVRRLTVWRPEMYTLTLLKERLERVGIISDISFEAGLPPDVTKLNSVSHRLGEIVSVMLKTSDNLCAESLLKYLGHARSGQKGTALDGLESIKDFEVRNLIPNERQLFVDGSGLSRYNLTSADAIVRLLDVMSRNPKLSAEFSDSLAIAGVDGRLALRMRGTPAEGKVRAKTGSMRGVSALAGYTVDADQQPIAFAFVMQNFLGPTQRMRDLQDRLAILLTEYSTNPQHTIVDRRRQPLLNQ